MLFITLVSLPSSCNLVVSPQIAEPSEDDPDVIPPFLGYAPNGTVETDQLVYVNYGRVEDFERLLKLGVDVKNKIAIMRYAKIYRGNKVLSSKSVNTANGALGLLAWLVFCLHTFFRKSCLATFKRVALHGPLLIHEITAMDSQPTCVQPPRMLLVTRLDI